MFSIQIFCSNSYALILHNPKYLMYIVFQDSLSVLSQLQGNSLVSLLSLRYGKGKVVSILLSKHICVK
jgi:hypothetical protein